MAFKPRSGSSQSSESPELMFRDIRTKKIQGLLSQQADLLREYSGKALDEPDVALQLPTGSGKTLVGLLIGEWRRRKFGEKVVYLCPTNQLVNQVVTLATTIYGLKVNGFVGPKKGYKPEAKSEFNAGEAIAVTSYSSVFNTDPFFEDPNIIILDDAHSGENYIPKLWSLRIMRSEHQEIYKAVASVFLDKLSSVDQQRIKMVGTNVWDRNWVEKIPTPIFFERIAELANVLDARVGDSELVFSWKMIRDHLAACHLFIDGREILIRPLVPPTFAHAPFAGAKQRIYMSATLGAGGDLERITGRTRIRRLQVPGWEKQGIGRRFFLFPDRSLGKAEAETLVGELLKIAGRGLVIVPDDDSASDFRKWAKEKLGFETFGAKDIEESKVPFISKSSAVAVVANRYDGIDFPDDECRLLVVAGLPRATNLQEKFFIQRLGAVSMLNDRILTRMVQAFGRCTRSATDFASVIIRGEELNTYLLASERRRFLHPELQAELQFGIDQSKNQKSQDFIENLSDFLKQDDQWHKADIEIVELRDGLTRQELPGTNDLRAAVAMEVTYQVKVWQGDYAGAFDECRSVLAHLEDSSLRGYRALWSYLAGSAAWLAFKGGVEGFDKQARAQYEAAKKAAPAVSWLVALSRLHEKADATPSRDEALALQVENLERNLEALGTVHDRKFADEEKFILSNLMESDSDKFEAAHERLGTFLGFNAGKVESSGSPDPWWILHDKLCLVFEDHSDGKTTTSLNVTKARQAASHPNWIRENVRLLAKDANIVPVLITPVSHADKDAMPHLKDVCIWKIEEFRAWASSAIQAIRDLRRTFPGSGDLAWRASAADRIVAAQADYASIRGMLLAKTADSVLKIK